MGRMLLFAALALAAVPGVTAAQGKAETPLPAGVDRDVFCHLLVAHTLEAQERLTDDQKAKSARMIDSIRDSASFYLGSVTARLSDSQVGDFARTANKALSAASEDDRARYLQYCLNDATRRASHYAERIEDN